LKDREFCRRIIVEGTIVEGTKAESRHLEALRLAQRVEQLLAADARSERAQLAKALARSLVDEIAELQSELPDARVA
jgi:hypothetical protein